MIKVKINYSNLNPKQQESYNFQKVSSILADYGYITIKLSDDWQGADFIAQHWGSGEFLKIQLKGRMTFDRKYIGKSIYLAFPEGGNWYIAPHDELLEEIATITTFKESSSWEKGTYSFPKLSEAQLGLLEKYKL